MSKSCFTSGDIVAMVRGRYSGRELNVVMEQVPNATGRYCNSHIDVMVVGLWPSSGLTRRAIEIKVERSDWLREAASENKNAWARQYCHEMWYAAPAGVIGEEEIPVGCGLFKATKAGLRIVRQAARNDKPDCDDLLVSAMARAMARECDRKLQSLEQAVLEKSPCYATAVRYQTGCEKFLTERLGRPQYCHSVDDVLSMLASASSGEEVNRRVERILEASRKFSSDLAEVLDLFVCVAIHGLEAKNELGQTIAATWGADTGNRSLSDLRRVSSQAVRSKLLERAILAGAEEGRSA